MDKCSIGFKTYTIVDEKMWIFSNSFNGLYVLDLLTEELQWKGQVPFESAICNELYTELIFWEGKLFFVPFLAHKLAVYDIGTGKFDAIDLPGMEQKKNLLFGAACLYKDSIYMFPFFDGNIVKLDLKSGEMCTVTKWAQDIVSYISKTNKVDIVYFRRKFVLLGSKIYIPFYEVPAILELDCESMETRIHTIDKVNCGYNGICTDGNDLWLVPKDNGKVIRWNLLNNQKKSYSYHCDMEDIGAIEWINNQKELGIYYDKRKRSIDSIPEVILYSYNNMYISTCNEQYDIIWDNDKDVLQVYNKKLKYGKEYLINVEYKDTPLCKAFQENIVKESKVQTVSRLLDAIDHTTKRKNQGELLIGEKIYQEITR